MACPRVENDEPTRIARYRGVVQCRPGTDRPLRAPVVHVLKHAIATGGKDTGWTGRDPDLAPLDDCEDFRRLVAELTPALRNLLRAKEFPLDFRGGWTFSRHREGRL